MMSIRTQSSVPQPIFIARAFFSRKDFLKVHADINQRRSFPPAGYNKVSISRIEQTLRFDSGWFRIPREITSRFPRAFSLSTFFYLTQYSGVTALIAENPHSHEIRYLIGNQGRHETITQLGDCWWTARTDRAQPSERLFFLCLGRGVISVNNLPL